MREKRIYNLTQEFGQLDTMGIPTKNHPKVPPARGSFPLDREGKCKEIANEYLNCIQNNKYNSKECRELSKLYLECRMEKNLMVPEEWDKLGFSKEQLAE